MLGDEKYGRYELNKLLQKAGHKRMFLHAFETVFRHPVDGVEVRLQARLPAAFETLMKDCHEPV
jgi:23S rRNA pseudouridine955/2504/2580 synthase